MGAPVQAHKAAQRSAAASEKTAPIRSLEDRFRTMRGPSGAIDGRFARCFQSAVLSDWICWEKLDLAARALRRARK
jgi:hypothetical protein